MRPAVWIDCSASGLYKFRENHPFHPIRLALTERLLRRSGALSDELILPPVSYSEADRAVERLHRSDYVTAVRLLSGLSGDQPVDIAHAHAHVEKMAVNDQADRYGLAADGDNPFFPDMHQAATAVVGGSLAAAEAVMSGNARRALHLAGGLHHAFPDRASGFCVYNDAAAAIAHIRAKYGARVLYVDTDVHHGDGVQWFFYEEPDVFTLSIHETGKYLFPGTGYSYERGEASGYGACLNLSMEPYTEDDSWLEVFATALEKAAAVFRPDVIISQHGCDAHAFDPLAHMQCSMSVYKQMPELLRDCAEKYAEGRWMALGGGGYDHWRVVPRAWSLLWLTMSAHPLLQTIDAEPLGGRLPDHWAAPYEPPMSALPLPLTWLDDTSAWPDMPRRSEIAAKNRAMLELALQHIG